MDPKDTTDPFAKYGAKADEDPFAKYGAKADEPEVAATPGPAVVPEPAAPVKPPPSFWDVAKEEAKRQVIKAPLAQAVGAVEAVPFAPQAVAGLRSLVGPESYKDELAKVREQLAFVREQEPLETTKGRMGMELAMLPIAEGKGLSLAAKAARFGGLGALQEYSKEGTDLLDALKAAGLSAAIPAGMGLAGKAAEAISPVASTSGISAGLRRAGQALLRTATPAALAAPQVSTVLSPETDTSGRLEALANLGMLAAVPTFSAYQGLKRMGAERARSIAEQAQTQAEKVIGEREAARGQEAVKAQRTAEQQAYEETVGLETGKELQARAAEAEQNRLKEEYRRKAEVKADKEGLLLAREAAEQNHKDAVRRAQRNAEDRALTDAQERQDVASEARIWEQKNARAQRAVKDEQRVVSAAERLRSGDQAAIADMQAELGELKAAEDALTRGDDPSLRGAIAKKYQDMRHRLETALKMFQDDGVEPPEAYRQAYDSVRESYLRNTAEQGYVGFGSNNELFLEDPKAWAEGERTRRLNKVQADRTGKEAAIVRFLEGMAQRDYMAEARTAKAGSQIPEARIRELFAEQGLEYKGGPLVDQSGVRVNQPLFGNRVPRAPFTSPEALKQSIERRRALQAEQDEARRALSEFRKSEVSVATAKERKDAERFLELEARRAAGFSGLTERQAVEQAVRGRMPQPAGLTDEEILQAANVTPAEAARLLAEQRAAARNVAEFGTPEPKASTQRRMDLGSLGRALYETTVPAGLRGGVLLRGLGGRVSGSDVARRTLPEYSQWTSPTLSTEARMKTPFEALEIAGAFERLLKKDSEVEKNFRRFVATVPGATWLSYLRGNPVVAGRVEAERQSGAAP